ncbi:MAG: thiolase family protein [Rhodospirillaceae bacterium]|jgi:acetyl-CoA acetyltransferase|nr:thiolase family protein [Rhodospirillaceae bacterium]MBT4690143.1 thiolase family protein [Rhodospirillaceae bacterium]MBT5080708.1 thiolase family protein [Rhodospirillaceae bacterium]MBT5524236.1 thiolase family protein [Rhodospirillaceae bacterium]MBT5877699.1 thiolase family protein [Rhodospirillaceae bacterium]
MPRDAEIPYGAYWSTPFARWQGSLSHLHSLEFAAHVAGEELARRNIPLDQIDHGILGMTVPQHQSFYGLPWVTGMMGADGVAGPTISQACATGARTLAAACHEVRSGLSDSALILTTDRTSNGPHVYYPAPAGPGGTGSHEDVVMDNFNHDPYAKNAMVDTAENVAAKYQISTAEQHDVVLRRHAQYNDALADDHAFQRRYMTLPFDIPDGRFRKTVGSLTTDEGVANATAEGLAKLKPVRPNGTITFGGQTHPADGTVGLLVTTEEKARQCAKDPSIRIRVLGFGQSRTEKGYMPQAPVEAAQRALDDADLGIGDMDAVKSHNPFAVNDIVFSRETGFDLGAMNNFGCSLIWGHPQGPTGLRTIVELIEELALKGGGRGLFQGCAAGDSAMSVVLDVSSR